MTNVLPVPPPEVATASGPPGLHGSGARRSLRAAVLERLQVLVATTPRRLRLLALAAVAAALVVGLGAAAAVRERAAALEAATATAEHLLLVQTAQTRLIQADADATQAFLSSGLEPLAERTGYVQAVQQASDELVLAAAAGPDDAQAFGQANAALTRYTGYIGAARANERLSVPVGGSYLTVASTVMREQILPQLQSRADADAAELSAALTRSDRAGLWLLAVLLVGGAGLAAVQWHLAQLSRRFLNRSLVAASALLLVAGSLAASVLVQARSSAHAVRDGPLASATALSRSRVQAYSAQSLENLTLLRRGSATQDDAAWRAQFTGAREALTAVDSDGEAIAAWDAYGEAHVALHTQHLNGDWEGALDAARATGDGSARAAFERYADLTGALLAQDATAARAGLQDAGGRLVPTAALAGLLGLLAAGLAGWGVSRRLQEYR